MKQNTDSKMSIRNFIAVMLSLAAGLCFAYGLTFNFLTIQVPKADAQISSDSVYNSNQYEAQLIQETAAVKEVTVGGLVRSDEGLIIRAYQEKPASVCPT